MTERTKSIPVATTMGNAACMVAEVEVAASENDSEPTVSIIISVRSHIPVVSLALLRVVKDLLNIMSIVLSILSSLSMQMVKMDWPRDAITVSSCIPSNYCNHLCICLQ